jgi:predicted phage tail protein
MQSTIVEITNWARPHVGRRIHRVKGRSRIDTQLRKQGLIVGRGRRMRRVKPFVVTTDGKNFLLASDWKRCLKDGEVLIVIAQPPAGGGGGSRILAVLAIVALSIVTAGAAAVLATGLSTVAAATATTLGAVVYGVTAAAVTMIGNALLNAIMPPPKPPAGQNRGDTSPNYSIGAQGNTARLMESMPVLYGRFRSIPDFAAQPYTDYRGNDQYLYQLFVVTQGTMQIEQIRLGETDVGSFEDVQYEVIQPGGQVTLFPDNVVTSQDVAGIQLQYPADGGTWSGPFVACPPETQTNLIVLDMAWPGGLYRYDTNGKKQTANSPWQAQAQLIDDEGNTLGDWFDIENESKWSDSEKAIFTSYNCSVPAGRYQVRVRANAPQQQDGQIVNQISWQGLKAFLPSQLTYGDCTMIAMVLKAGEQVSGANSRQLNVIGTRILPVWDGANWTNQATRNPAWAIADAFRNTTYGRGWADSRINLPGLLAHAQTWDTRGDTYDGIFDTKVTLWDAVTQIARVGRAMPMYYAGVVELIRDEPHAAPTLLVTPDTILSNTLKISYSVPTFDTSDFVQVEYTNTNTWQPQTVDCALTGSAKLNPKSVQLTGCTSRDHAFREGMYMSACNRDQRKFVTWQMELDGLIPQYGDRIDISHDMPQWGISGRIVSYDPATMTLETSQELAWFEGQQHFVGLRALNGSGQGPFKVVQGADLTHMVLTDLTDEQKEALFISDGSSAEPTAFQFGPGSQQAQSVLMLSCTPQGNNVYELRGVNYAPSVYIAENDSSVPPPGSPSLLTPVTGAPDVGSIGVNQNPGTQTVHLYVAPVAGASAYEFQISFDGGVTWRSVGISPTNTIDAVIPAGTWIVRARAIGVNSGIPGSWNQNPVTVDGKPWPLGALQSLSATSMLFGIRLLWAFPTGFGVLDAAGTEVRYGVTNDLSASQLYATPAYPNNVDTIQGLKAGDSFYFWARLVSKTNNAPGPWVGPVVGQASSDASPILTYLTGQITQTQLAQDLLQPIQLATPDMAGDADEYAGDGINFAGSWTLLSFIQDGDNASASRVDLIQATVGDMSAAVQVSSQAVADLNGRISAGWGVKTQLAANGQRYMASIAVGVDASGPVVTSQILLGATTLAIFDPNDPASIAQFPFIVTGGQVFIQSAFIADGTITNAKIGNSIQSTSTNSSAIPNWLISKTGAQGGYMQFANDAMTNTIDGNGLRMKVLATSVLCIEIGALS